jgi:RHS repeat-associated protein
MTSNGRTVHKLEKIATRLIVGECILAQIGIGFAAAAVAPAMADQPGPQATAGTSGPAVKVNRTVPKVEPPRSGLEFSANPSPEEIFRARVFAEPLVPVGGEPTAAENAALTTALLGYSKRSSPDDFSSLTGFLKQHPQSAWQAALLTDLGLEYYNTAHYSLALEAWARGWALAKSATEPKAKAIGDRAAGELAYMYGRLGRMNELDELLKSVERRVFCGPATERISGARAGLANMKERPGIAFRCGPLALHRIKLAVDAKNPGDLTIFKSASTQQGFSLAQVADLSSKVDLHYQMAFREKGAAFVAPAVVHWKVGHYAAMIRQEGGRFLLQDPTFWNDVWVTPEALEAETSGYFLVPPGPLPKGWRAVAGVEGGRVWGKGNVCCNCPDCNGCSDPKKPENCPAQPPCPSAGGGGGGGLAVANVHLMLVSLNIMDQPVGYSPPVGPAPRFVVTYNQREANQPTAFSYSNFGSKWTFNWLAYITDNPFSPSADVKYYIMGGGTRTFTGFDPTTQSFANEQYDHARLTRTGPGSYEMLMPDGSKNVFNQSDGSAGTTRKIFLTQVSDPFGNTLRLTYDADLRVVALTDALGQVTTLSYGDANDIYKITKVTDPFGRSASFDYDAFGRLIRITDVIGLTSQFVYDPSSDFINSLITPYGTNTFIRSESGTTRSLETIYPDGEHDRVEFNESTSLGIAASVPPGSLPIGMASHNDYLYYRNTYYWSKLAYASAYPDYTKAKIYHWLHTADGSAASGVLESTKEPLEGRVWNDYAGQSDPIIVGTNNLPSHVGRVLDDGSTQLYTYEYNGFGHTTRTIDPVGRTFSFLYATNGIDLLEVRQTRAGNNELLFQMTYNAQHLPLTKKDAAGQTTTYTYNSLGQLLTETNPRGDTTTYSYDTNRYLVSLDGPLPGPGDRITWTYDPLGRVRTQTEVDGYLLTFDYDALDRFVKITYPDSTFDQFAFTRLDRTLLRDRAGRQTTFEYNSIRQLTKRTDPLNRVTLFQWCKCGDSRTLTDPMGRTTTWHHDIQGRVTAKEYADGSRIVYLYETTTKRLRQRIDEQLQVTQYTYNRDNTVSAMSYVNAAVPTPSVTFSYDPNYNRLSSMTDVTGRTLYGYVPITSPPALGAGLPAFVDGPLPNDTISFAYDELGRRTSIAINGVTATSAFDAAGRLTGVSNVLGSFAYSYDGSSTRPLLMSGPSGLTAEWQYGGNAQDNLLQRLTHKMGGSVVSDFVYGQDVPAERIVSWSQQAGAQSPSIYTFGYDAADQLLSATLTNGGAQLNTFAYSYDPAANRLGEQVGSAASAASYNTLNQLTAVLSGAGASATNQWDAEGRLAAVNVGNQRTEFTYDGLGRRVGIRLLVDGSEVSNRRFLWCDDRICEERTPAGAVTKRYFLQGMRVETGPAAGSYFYTADHLGSIRELLDSAGSVRARYAYDPYGRRSRLQGDVDADFGFAGMFWSTEAALHLTRYRPYDAELGRWLSRDPLSRAELAESYNLYAYAHNNPVNLSDSLGLCCDNERAERQKFLNLFWECKCNHPRKYCLDKYLADLKRTLDAWNACVARENCKDPDPQPPANPCVPGNC